MKFHGVTMTGPFVNQKLSALPAFDAVRDPARLVWLLDGTIWYGSDTEWVNFSSGAGDANEVEDMYSDLLRTTIFLNGSYDEFADEDRVYDTDMTYSQKYKEYTYISGQYIESIDVFDPLSGLTWVDYVLPSVDFVGSGADPIIEVTSDGGTNWHVVANNQVYRIDNDVAGTDLRMRMTAQSSGTLKSWGIMYNKDLTAACTKYGLTYANFEATNGQTTFEVDYQPGAVTVFVNGDMMDSSDYDASSGTEIEFSPGLSAGDIVYILSFSTSILDPNVDFNDFIKHNGSVTFTANQPMGGNKLTGLGAGVDPNDSVTLQQLTDAIGGVDLSDFIKRDGTVVYTSNQPMGNFKLTGLTDGSASSDSINKGQLDTAVTALSGAIDNNSTDITALSGAIDIIAVSQEIKGGDITVSGNDLIVTGFECTDSTGLIPLEKATNTTITIPSSATNQIYHIYAVRYVAGSIAGVKAYKDESDVMSDTAVDAWRWLDFWKTDGIGVPLDMRTYDGMKYMSDCLTYPISATMTPTMAPLEIWNVAPIDKISSWLPAATWDTPSPTTTAANSSQLEIGDNGVNVICTGYNYGATNDVEYMWCGKSNPASTTASIRVIQHMDPRNAHVRVVYGATVVTTWTISFQQIKLRR